MAESREDIQWVLNEATKPEGFMPHASSTVDLLVSLETEGLVRQLHSIPVWGITDAGRKWLKENAL